jgi:membrane protease YdiL (CAAX protease family)
VRLPPAGWHPDPGDPGRQRWWGGDAWTTWVHEHGEVVEVPLPARPLGIQRWPTRVVGLSVLGLLGITFAVGIAYAAVAAVVGTSTELLLGITFPVQYGLMYLLVRELSRRYGTGRVTADLCWRVERRDVWPGIGTAFLALVVTAVVVNLARSVLGLPSDPTDQFGSLDDTTPTQVMIAIAAVIGAPLFEELLFRGVVLHALLVWGEVVAILGSSLLFGLTHLNPELGLDQNVLLLVSTTATGCVLAWVARRAERLGPGMVAHAGFNLLAVILLFSG